MRSKHVQVIVVCAAVATFLSIAAVMIKGIVDNATTTHQPAVEICGGALQQDANIYQAVAEHRTTSETWYEGYAAVATSLEDDLRLFTQETSLEVAATSSVEFSKQQAAAADTNPNPATLAAFTAALQTSENDIAALLVGCHAKNP